MRSGGVDGYLRRGGWLSQTRPIPRSPDGDNNLICATKGGKELIAIFTFPIEEPRLIGSRTLISVPRKLVTRNQQIIIWGNQI